LSKRQHDERIARAMSEETWRQHVRRLANPDGVLLWPLTYHTLDSRGSDSGWPDEVFGDCRERRLLLLELKRQSGRLTTTQVGFLDWLARFRDSGNPGVEVYGAVRPLDRDALLLTLQGATEAEGALHQWCVRPECGRCGRERDGATVVLRMPKRRGRRT
jgi:hypothetical protein